MSIFDHFANITLGPGQENAVKGLELFLEGKAQIFILKGYAGSGKTTILRGIIEFLGKRQQNFIIMAPTGRAAKVLREKTGSGSTIHKAIYNFSRLVSINQNSDDDAEHSFHYYFPINETDRTETIIIVDEASMISSKQSKHELFTFGTDVLLDDLLTYAKLSTTNNKLILVGDPAQLPPVGDNKSLALERSYFEQLGYDVHETELTEVLRQGQNLILANATKLRNLLKTEKRTDIKFEYDESSFVKSKPEEFIEKYTELFPSPEIGNGVVISYSNAQCFHINSAIRSKMFPNNPGIVAGDLILLNNNNYHTYGVELFNGDIAKVIEVSGDTISQSAPVICDVAGEKVRMTVKLDFRQITIRVPSHPEEIKCYIIESLLNSIDRDLSICEMKALYVNVKIRFQKDQQKRKENGLTFFGVGSEEFKQALKSDPFYNALRVKFGYAITCHKAQGGEWDKVFVDYHGRVSLKDDPIKWCYTATTRGINTVYAVNAPHFGKFDHFKIGPIGSIGTLPNDALSFENTSLSPFHKTVDHKCKSKKYWEIAEKLESTLYEIKKVETFNGHLERYTVTNGDKDLQIQAYHGRSGHFTTPFKSVPPNDQPWALEVESLFNSKSQISYSINYTPDLPFLDELLSQMQAICNELDIPITNITKGANHFVTYYLQTDSTCAYIQFYYNDKEQLTTALPRTFDCSDDKKLNMLIQNLLKNAS
jgi:hypothetical protein